MREMGFMEKLLVGVGVEWIEVGKLISPQRGKRLVRSQLEESGSYAVYQNRADSSPSATFVQCTESAWKLSRCKCCA